MDWLIILFGYRAGQPLGYGHPRRNDGERVVAKYRREPLPLWLYLVLAAWLVFGIASIIDLSTLQTVGAFAIVLIGTVWFAFDEGASWENAIHQAIVDLEAAERQRQELEDD